jgi:hypothetical protein
MREICKSFQGLYKRLEKLLSNICAYHDSRYKLKIFMKNIIVVLSLFFLASCASQKMTTSFTTPGTPIEYHHMTPIPTAPIESSPVLLTSTSKLVLPAAKPNTVQEFKKVYLGLTKHQKKEFRRELKKELKAYVKNKNSGLKVESTQASGSGMDQDLKFALIFGIIGILILSLISGQAAVIIGSIFVVVGIIFFIKWLIEL